MPRSTREWALRKLEQALGTLDWTGNHLIQVIEIYQEKHPEVSNPLNQVLEILLVADDLITHVRKGI